MFQNPKLKKIFSERNLFILFSIANLIPVCLTKYIGSLDGPQHLYASNIIAQLWKGNEIYQQFYLFNPLIVGNVLGNFTIAFFNLFTQAWLAEKLFLIICLTLFATGFRYLVISIKGKSDYITLLIFPFSYHALFMLGYYNYSIAIAGLFFALGYWIRKRNNLHFKEVLTTLFLFTITYYSHVFVFAMLLFLIGLITTYYFIEDLAIKDKGAIIKYIKSASIAIICATPGLILTYLYLTNVPNISPSNGTITEFNHWEYIMNLKMLIGYDHKAEGPFTRMLFYLLLFLFSTAILLRIYKLASEIKTPTTILKSFINKNDIWLVFGFILFILYIFLPNHMSMPVRVSILFLYIVILWIALQDFPFSLSFLSIGLIIYLGISIKTIHLKYLRPLSATIEDIHSIESYIPANELIITSNYSDNWILYHFQNYIGVDKPIIDIKSPACSKAFAVNWNDKKRPFTFVGAKNAAYFSGIGNSPYNSPAMIAKYIVVMGFNQFQRIDPDDNLNQIIKRDYQLVHVSEHKNVGLYRFSAGKQINEYRTTLINNPGSVKLLKEKAKEYNIPFETALLRDALWMYDNNNE